MVNRWPYGRNLVEHLDWAYQHRDALQAIGGRAGEDMVPFTWAQTARLFAAALSPHGMPGMQMA
jgi:hypothetical protein